METITGTVRNGMGNNLTHTGNQKGRFEAIGLYSFIGKKIKIQIVEEEVTRHEEGATITEWKKVE